MNNLSYKENQAHNQEMDSAETTKRNIKIDLNKKSVRLSVIDKHKQTKIESNFKDFLTRDQVIQGNRKIESINLLHNLPVENLFPVLRCIKPCLQKRRLRKFIKDNE